ncbi:MAG: nuclear transport factor 2 family protein [Hyphomicrobiaceae bacterium]|nr:nuclear transport factor 2 family protein [Hyphomicrobiaceae bacterium]
MIFNDYLVLKNAYAAWGRGDLATLESCFAPDLRFDVPASATARSYIGSGVGRHLLVARLRNFLAPYEVKRFKPISAFPTEHGIEFRVQYDYRSKATGLDVQGTQRHLWTVSGNEITTFTVVHDARLLAAFFDLTEPLSV